MLQFLSALPACCTNFGCWDEQTVSWVFYMDNQTTLLWELIAHAVCSHLPKFLCTSVPQREKPQQHLQDP